MVVILIFQQLSYLHPALGGLHLFFFVDSYPHRVDALFFGAQLERKERKLRKRTEMVAFSDGLKCASGKKSWRIWCEMKEPIEMLILKIEMYHF